MEYEKFSEQNSNAENGAEASFGQRYLCDESSVFDCNAWDDVDWPVEKEEEIQRAIDFQRSHPVPENVASNLLELPNAQWDSFYQAHGNKFFMNRKWVLREFSELNQLEKNVPIKILDVGCGVGNTIIPILQTTGDNLFAYCCDFSRNAIELLRADARVPSVRCHPFIWDITQPNGTDQVPKASLDFILCVFILSAIPPDCLKIAIENLVCLLKPGGMLMVKDYGRHDLTQLRFKRDRFIDENFYRRGDGTLVSFFTNEMLHALFTDVGLERVQNITEKRLVVNRAKKITMYRRWVQCKYLKKSDVVVVDNCLY